MSFLSEFGYAESITVTTGSTATLPVLEQEGFTFIAWTDQADGSGVVYDNTTILTSDVTLYAKWSEDVAQFTVTFLENGAADLEDLVVNDGDVITLTSYERPGYTFSGWAYDVSFDGEFLYADESFTVTEDVVLFAVFEYYLPMSLFTFDEFEVGYRDDVAGYKITGFDYYGFTDIMDADYNGEYNLYLPQTYNGLPILTIKNSAFADETYGDVFIPEGYVHLHDDAFENVEISTLTLPTTLSWIGGNSFYSATISTVNFAENANLQVIGNYAFEDATIDVFNLPDSVEFIMYDAFGDSYINEFNVSDTSNLKIIGENAFSSSSISSINLPEGLIVISDDAFEQTELTSLTIPSTVVYIGYDAFYNDYLTNITFNNLDNLIYVEDDIVNPNIYQFDTVDDPYMQIIDGKLLVDYKIATYEDEYYNNTINYVIGDVVHYNNSYFRAIAPTLGNFPTDPLYFEEVVIDSIVIPEGVQVIGEDAFAYITTNSITLPSTLRTIGDRAFEHFTCPTCDIVFPNSVTHIFDSAFYHTTLNSVFIPNTVEYLGWGIFSHSNAVDITIEDNTEVFITGDLFSSAIVTNHLYIGEGVTKFEYGVFEYATINKLTLPSTLKELGDCSLYAHITTLDDSKVLELSYDNKDLYNVINPDSPHVQSDADGYITLGNALLYYDRNNNAATGDFVLPEGITMIIRNAVNYTDTNLAPLTSLDLTGVEVIFNNAIGSYATSALTTIEIPNSIKVLDGYAIDTNATITYADGISFDPHVLAYFEDWDDISFTQYSNMYDSITVDENGFYIIGNALFGFDGSATDIVIPAGIEIIADNALAEMNLDSVTLNEGLLYIGEASFDYNNLTTITIPASIMYIGSYAFDDNKLTEINFVSTDNLLYIEDESFDDNPIIMSNTDDFVIVADILLFYQGTSPNIVIPDTVRIIASDGLEEGHTRGYNVFVPNTVEVLSAEAFDDLKFTSITFEEGIHLRYIGAETFEDGRFVQLTLPDNIDYIHPEVFNDYEFTIIYLLTLPEGYIMNDFDDYEFYPWSD